VKAVALVPSVDRSLDVIERRLIVVFYQCFDFAMLHHSRRLCNFVLASSLEKALQLRVGFIVGEGFCMQLHVGFDLFFFDS
jgi:hypothetical protein